MFILSVVVMAMVFTTSALADGGKKKKKPDKKNKGAPDYYIVSCEFKGWTSYIETKTAKEGIQICINGKHKIPGKVKGVQPMWWGKKH